MGACVTIDGFLGRDAELKTTPQGLEIASVSVAVNHMKGRDKETTTSWFQVKVFGKGAESLRNWQKGDFVIVSGDLEIREFTGRDGQKGTAAEISGRSWSNVSHMMRAREGGGGTPRGASYDPAGSGAPAQQQRPAPAPRQQSTVEDDLPF